MRRNEVQPGYGEWLRFYRERAGLTQRELAGDAGVSYVTVNHLENGRRRASERVIQLLASELGVKPAEMLFPDGKIPTPSQIVEQYLATAWEGRE